MINYRHKDMSKHEGEDLPKEPLKDRLCLACLKNFPSKHRFNRICYRCSKYIEYKNLNENDGGYGGVDRRPISERSEV